jgi:hypothetical protein
VKRFLRRVFAPHSGAPRESPKSKDGTINVDDQKDWKAKATDAIARAKKLEEDAKHQAKRAEKFRLAAERMEQRVTEFDTLTARLREVERELAIAREHLMAVEVKLDILEGAANVLDIRTRAAIHQHPAETGARA